MHPIRFLKRLSHGFAMVGQVWGLPEKWAKLKAAFKTLLFALVGLTILLLVLWWFLPDDWPIKYAAEYIISTDQVMIERKPHNCDWDSAPLGNKHCHYKSIVTLYDSVGVVIRNDNVNVTPTKIHVEWERVEE